MPPDFKKSAPQQSPSRQRSATIVNSPLSRQSSTAQTASTARSTGSIFESVKQVFRRKQNNLSQSELADGSNASVSDARSFDAEPMPDEDVVNEQFAELAESLGFDASKRSSMSTSGKWSMLLQARRGAAKAGCRESSPDAFIARMKGSRTFYEDGDFLKRLRITMGSQPILWIKEFAAKRGTALMLHGLVKLFFHPSRPHQQQGNQALALAQFGLQFVMRDPDAVDTIALFTGSPSWQSRHAAFQFLAVFVHLNAPDTHQAVLASLQRAQKQLRDVQLFDTVITHLAGDFEEAVKDAAMAEYLIDAVIWMNAVVSGIEGEEALEMRFTVRNQLFRAPLRSAFHLYKDINDDRLTGHCEAFLCDLQQDADLLEGQRGLVKAKLASWTSIQLVSALDNSEPLKQLLSELCALTDLHRSAYLTILNALLCQLVLHGHGLAPELSVHPPLDLDALLRSVSASERSILVERELATAQAALMRHELEWKEQRVAFENTVEDLQLQLQTRRGAAEKTAETIRQLQSDVERLRLEVERLEAESESDAEESTSDKGCCDGEIEVKRITASDEAITDIEAKASSTLPALLPSAPPGVKSPPPPPPPIPLAMGSSLSGVKGPPPPPPPIPGGPNPPTALHPGLQGPPARPRQVPSRKTRQLQWDKLADREIAGTVWEQLDDLSWEKRIDLGTIELFFATRADAAESTPPSPGRKASVSEEVTFVDSKRALNISIILGSIKLDVSEIRRALLSVDYRVITESLVDQFINYAPTPDELAEARRYTEADRLRKAEAFFVQVAGIDGYAELLRALKLKFTFRDWLDAVQQELHPVEELVKAVERSKAMQQVLEMVLLVGNFLNHGTHKGNARGFRIRSLTKTRDNRSTLMHHMASVWEDQHREALAVLSDLTHAALASKFSFASVSEQVLQKQGTLQAMHDWIAGYKPTEACDRVREVLVPIIAAFSAKLASITAQIDAAKRSCASLARRFAEDPSSDELFSALAQFRADLERCRLDLERERAQRAADAKKRESGGRARIARIWAGEEGGQMVDSMLETLRHAND